MAIFEKNEKRIIDPVCGMTINKKGSVSNSSYEGVDYYFCSEKCKMLFDEDPDAVFAMKVAREEVAEGARTESLDRIAEELAHEIRNPLTSIGGFVRRVHEMLPGNDPGRKYLEIVIENVARIENMIQKLVELKTTGAFQKELTDVNDIIIETVTKKNVSMITFRQHI